MSPAIKPNAWAGVGKETVWGTPVAVTQYMRIVSESLRPVKDPVKSKSARPGLVSDMRFTPQRAEGDLVLESNYAGREMLLFALMGTYDYSVDTPVAGVNQHEFILNSAAWAGPEGLTLEVFRDINATTRGHQYSGMLPYQYVLEFDDDEILSETWSLYGKDEIRITPSSASPSFNVENEVMGMDLSTKVVAGSSDICIKSGRFTIETPRDNARACYGSSNKAKPIIIGPPMVTLEMDIEWEDDGTVSASDIYDMFVNESAPANPGALLKFDGDIITGATAYSMLVGIPRAKITGETPQVDGNEGIITMSLKMEAVNVNGTDYPTITLFNDTTEVTT